MYSVTTLSSISRDTSAEQHWSSDPKTLTMLSLQMTSLVRFAFQTFAGSVIVLLSFARRAQSHLSVLRQPLFAPTHRVGSAFLEILGSIASGLPYTARGTFGAD